jgi:hypothetical protein
LANAAEGSHAYGAARAGDNDACVLGCVSKPNNERRRICSPIVGDLDETVLAIRSTGRGKTFCGARMICELVGKAKSWHHGDGSQDHRLCSTA